MIRCGNRVHTNPKTQYADLVATVHHHPNVATVKLCFKQAEGFPSIEEEEFNAAIMDEIEGDIEAERRNERFWEEGPNGGYYAGSREEMRDNYADAGFPLPPGF